MLWEEAEEDEAPRQAPTASWGPPHRVVTFNVGVGHPNSSPKNEALATVLEKAFAQFRRLGVTVILLQEVNQAWLKKITVFLPQWNHRASQNTQVVTFWDPRRYELLDVQDLFLFDAPKDRSNQHRHWRTFLKVVCLSGLGSATSHSGITRHSGIGRTLGIQGGQAARGAFGGPGHLGIGRTPKISLDIWGARPLQSNPFRAPLRATPHRPGMWSPQAEGTTCPAWHPSRPSSPGGPRALSLGLAPSWGLSYP